MRSCAQNMLSFWSSWLIDWLVHLYPPITRKRRCTMFWTNPQPLKSWPFSKLSCWGFDFFPRKFAACSKPPSRDNYRKASYPRTQQRDQGASWTHDPAIRVVVKTTLLPIRPCCRQIFGPRCQLKQLQIFGSTITKHFGQGYSPINQKNKPKSGKTLFPFPAQTRNWEPRNLFHHCLVLTMSSIRECVGKARLAIRVSWLEAGIAWRTRLHPGWWKSHGSIKSVTTDLWFYPFVGDGSLKNKQFI